MLPWLFAAILSHAGASPTKIQCLGSLIHHEARGEPLNTQRAVLQVVYNRMKFWNMTACEVIMQKGQFPWAARKRSWKISAKTLDAYHLVAVRYSLLDETYFYFNTVKSRKWGKKRGKKIGKLIFY